MIEKGRHIGISREHRFCIHCDNVIEDEFHFLLVCPLYDILRVKYIPNHFYENPNLYNFVSLMSMKNTMIIRNLAMFLYYAFKLRTEILN